MCWEKEEEYEKCFDHVWGLNIDDGVKDILEWGGIEFTNEEKCKEDFFTLLTLWHNEGKIKPKS
jgi:hypothetical protein